MVETFRPGIREAAADGQRVDRRPGGGAQLAQLVEDPGVAQRGAGRSGGRRLVERSQVVRPRPGRDPDPERDERYEREADGGRGAPQDDAERDTSAAAKSV